MATVLADRLLLSRRDLDITQEDLASRAGNVSAAYISSLERGKVTNPSVEVIEAIATALGVSPAYLLGWTDIPLPEEDATIPQIAEPRVAYNIQDLTGIDDEEALGWLAQRSRSLADLMRAVKNLPDDQRSRILDHITRQLDLLVSLTTPTQQGGTTHDARDRDAKDRHQ